MNKRNGDILNSTAAQKFKKSAFIFRRDLRLDDNLGLLAALEQSEQVVAVFNFDPRQTDQKNNEYFSAPAFAFLINSLAELEQELKEKNTKLYFTFGSPEDTADSLIKNDEVDAIFVNKDYTPFARKRDKKILDAAAQYNAPLFRIADYTLSDIENIKTGQNKFYSIFTPFLRNAMQDDVPTPQKNKFTNFWSGKLKTKTIKLSKFKIENNPNSILKGGRKEALKILKNNQYLENYRKRRDLPAEQGTSRLSAHHKFGTISIREIYRVAEKKVGTHNQFIYELYWRDFYYYIAYHFPVVFKQSFLPWAKYLKWVNNKKHFAAWCEGKTGVPMVDAAMRELNTTGWMHNRSRMVVASYLTKNLLIDWRWGERYFASKLIDYDPAQNNGGWQWSASTGADPKPLRIFNPYTQAVKYDEQAVYIKKWVPELELIDSKLLTDGKTQDFSILAKNYPAPLIDQKESFHRAMATYRAAKDKYYSTLENK